MRFIAILTREFLIEQLITNDKTILNLSLELNCNEKTIRRYLIKYGISLKSIGERSYQFKGRRYNTDGYIEIYSPKHPYKTKNKTVLEYRLVMEKKLGRYLTPEEDIHHINEIKDDNDPNNLELHTNSEHLKIHYKDRKIDLKTGRLLKVDK